MPTPWICLADAIRRAGIDPGSLQRIPDRTMEQNEAALRAGELDAIHVFQPYAERLIALRRRPPVVRGGDATASPPTPRW